MPSQATCQRRPPPCAFCLLRLLFVAFLAFSQLELGRLACWSWRSVSSSQEMSRRVQHVQTGAWSCHYYDNKIMLFAIPKASSPYFLCLLLSLTSALHFCLHLHCKYLELLEPIN